LARCGDQEICSILKLGTGGPNRLPGKLLGRGGEMKKVILILLVIPLIIVLAAKDPQGMGHLVQLIITVGAKLLNAVATLISDLLGSHAK
jgi:hypothetical protein